MRVQPARPEEYDDVGELTVRAYAADGHGGSAYAERLRDAAGRAGAGELLVATRSVGADLVAAAAGEPLLGTVALFAAGATYAQLAGPGEVEIRMLAVDPGARGHGVGGELAVACLQRALAGGAIGIRLSTERSMTAAHRIYERVGFRRTPDRDWSPTPGATLITYALDLRDGGEPLRRPGRPDVAARSGRAGLSRPRAPLPG